MNVDPWSILLHGVTWSALGAILLLLNGWANRFISKNAAARHQAYILVFLGIALLPLWQIENAESSEEAHKTLAPSPPSQTNLLPAGVCLPGTSVKYPGIPITLLGVWLGGTLLNLGKFARAFSKVKIWRKHSHSFRPESVDIQLLTNRIGLSREFELRISGLNEPKIPVTWGIWAPVVLLPMAALNWNRERLEAVLLHEFSHIRRRDPLSQLLGIFNCSIHWFNPFFWRAAQRMEAEAEIAADDCALLAGIKPSTYASELLQLASQLRFEPRKAFLVGASMTRTSGVETRIRAIIDPGSDRSQARRLSFLKVQAFALLLVLGMAYLQTAFSGTVLIFKPAEPKPMCPPPPIENSPPL